MYHIWRIYPKIRIRVGLGFALVLGLGVIWAKSGFVTSQVAHGAGVYPVSVVLGGWESLTPPERDTNPSQVSSQQILVLIYLPRKDGKWSWLRQKRRSHNRPVSNSKLALTSYDNGSIYTALASTWS